MKYLEDKIVKEGKLIGDDILKVDGFLNHRLDVECLDKMGEELYRLYKDAGVNKVLTIEASGIAIACSAARCFKCPVVFAKKSKSRNTSDDFYTTKVKSFTHNTVYDVTASKEYLSKEDKVLIVDDFLAEGNALKGLIDLVKQAGGEVVGCGVAIEKAFQGGGDQVRSTGIRVESLAKIESMSAKDGIKFSK